MTCRLAFAVGCLLSAAAAAAETPVETAIDARMQAKWKADGVTPAAQLADEGYIRRVTLDLVGRIPTGPEVTAYTASKEPNKREQLVDRLLASPAYARYQGYLFEYMLNEKSGRGALRDYLTAAVAENRPWDVMYRQMLVPNEADPKQKGAADYLRPKLADLDALTGDVSAAFFGVNVSCAQCHDHPLVDDWKQDHFYGMKSFFARSYDAGGMLAERPAGLMKYKPNKGAERQAQMMFLTGTAVKSDTVREMTKDEQKAEKAAIEKAKSAKVAPPAPAFSARQKLVEVSLAAKSGGFFSKAIVNRLWHRFLGTGLVNPLDQMHSANPPSHPELLAELAEDLELHKYDLRRLIRGIVLSKTYSVSSKYESESQPLPTTFAVARIRALTPWQLASSLKIAAADPKVFEGLKPADLEKKLEQFESAGRGMSGQFAMPGEKFQIGVSEALFFSNGDRVAKELLAEGNGTLLGRVLAEKDAEAAVKLLIPAVLNRPATAEDIATLGGFLTARRDRRVEAHRQVLWAMCTGPEFRFNH